MRTLLAFKFKSQTNYQVFKTENLMLLSDSPFITASYTFFFILPTFCLDKSLLGNLIRINVVNLVKNTFNPVAKLHFSWGFA